MCGFIGIVSPPGNNVIGEIYDGLTAIQHRGQDAAGALTYDGRFHLHKGAGLVRDVFRQKVIARLVGNVGLGHVRYPTAGGGTEDDAQPLKVSSPYGIGMAHNGNLTNFASLKKELSEVDRRHVDTECDVEAILQVFASELSKSASGELDDDQIFTAVAAVFRRCKGAYSVVTMIAGYGLVAFRDPLGIKPIILGERTGKAGRSVCIASESVLLDILDYHRSTDLGAGEAAIVRLDGEIVRRKVTDQEHRPCLFEWVYFARPDSFLDRVSVYKTRLRCGEAMAEKWTRDASHLNVDVVMPVPESARDAAAAMARALGKKYREGLVKNRYIGRTFIMPDNDGRRRSIRQKLNAIQLEFENKDVMLVDDSIVRGNTSRQIVQLARDAGARSVYFVSYSPPLVHPCVYGIDMSTRNEFVARGRDSGEIAEEIGADFVMYQDLPDLEEAVREGNPELKKFCTACFTGDYPTGDVTSEVLARIEGERLVVQGAIEPLSK